MLVTQEGVEKGKVIGRSGEGREVGKVRERGGIGRRGVCGHGAWSLQWEG